MEDTTHPIHLELPSLAKATAVSLAIALVGLTFVVLPQAYGIDPTGLGTAMGFAPDPQAPGSEAVDRTQELSVLVGPNRTLEHSYPVQANWSLSITWNSTEPVNVTLHAVDVNGTQHQLDASWGGNRTWQVTTVTAPVTGDYVLTVHNPGPTPAEIELRLTASNH